MTPYFRKSSVSDTYYFDADPDPSKNRHADPDPKRAKISGSGSETLEKGELKDKNDNFLIIYAYVLHN